MSGDRRDDHVIRSKHQLEALYGRPSAAAVARSRDRLQVDDCAFIKAARFMVLATVGASGLDVSPRGECSDVVTIADEQTLLLADRRGNNRLESLSNILTDERVGLLFLIAGISQVLRVRGRALLSVDPAVLERLTLETVPPRVVIIVKVEQVYLQSTRAIRRADLWNPRSQIEPGRLPGLDLQALSD